MNVPRSVNTSQKFESKIKLFINSLWTITSNFLLLIYISFKLFSSNGNLGNGHSNSFTTLKTPSIHLNNRFNEEKQQLSTLHAFSMLHTLGRWHVLFVLVYHLYLHYLATGSKFLLGGWIQIAKYRLLTRSYRLHIWITKRFNYRIEIIATWYHKHDFGMTFLQVGSLERYREQLSGGKTSKVNIFFSRWTYKCSVSVQYQLICNRYTKWNDRIKVQNINLQLCNERFREVFVQELKVVDNAKHNNLPGFRPIIMLV